MLQDARQRDCLELGVRRVPKLALRTMKLDFGRSTGERITSSQLPPRGLKRWSVREKALVVAAVRHGLLTVAEACERYDLSLEEILAWQGTFDGVSPVRGDGEQLQ
jgi:hypothetical protein